MGKEAPLSKGLTRRQFLKASGATAAVTGTSSGVVGKASAGNVYGINVLSANAGFACLLNVTSVPSGGAAISPIRCENVPAGESIDISWTVPKRFSTGVVGVFTSSTTTYTAVTPLIFTLDVQ